MSVFHDIYPEQNKKQDRIPMDTVTESIWEHFFDGQEIPRATWRAV